MSVFNPNEHTVRHVDVAILWGMGMEDRAQHVARKLRPVKLTVESDVITDQLIQDARESLGDKWKVSDGAGYMPTEER